MGLVPDVLPGKLSSLSSKEVGGEQVRPEQWRDYGIGWLSVT
jgi:hypothetical protein